MPSVGHTLFVLDLAQKRAEAQAAAQAQMQGAEATERQQEMGLREREADRKEFETRAEEVGRQQEVLGDPQPEISDVGGRVAAQIGAGGARAKTRLETLIATRALQKAEEERAFKEYLARIQGGLKVEQIGAAGEQARETLQAGEPGRNLRAAIPGEQREDLETKVLEPGRMERKRMDLAQDATRGSRPTTGRLGQVQKRLHEIKMSDFDLDEIERAVPKGPDGRPDYTQAHTYYGRAKLWALKEIDRIPGFRNNLTPELQQWLADGASYASVVDKQRAEEFRAALGAAQTSIEVKNLVNAVLSRDMSPIQFEATLRSLRMRSQNERALLEKEAAGQSGVSLVVPSAGVSSPTTAVGARRTHPTTGETRVWNGSAWVPE